MIYLNQMAQARIKAQEEFKCEGCGNCCCQCFPITISEKDLNRLAEYFGKSVKVTFKRHCKLSDDKKMIVFKHDLPCKFYDPKKRVCKIYEARPDVCRMHPFLSGEDPMSETFKVPAHCPGALKTYAEMKGRGEVR